MFMKQYITKHFHITLKEYERSELVSPIMNDLIKKV